MGVIPGGSNPRPEGSLPLTGLGVLATYDENYVKAQASKGLKTAANDAQKGFLDGLKTTIVNPLRDIFAGLRPKQWEEVADAFHDGQLDLTSRIDLLDGLRGYCSAYQTLNVNSKYSYGDDRIRLLPFDGQVGPAKGAHIDAERKGIVFEEAGAWLIFSMAKTDHTGYATGNSATDGSSITMRIYSPDGQEFSKTTVASASYNMEDSLVIVRTVVIPQPGSWVTVESWSSRWRRWLGGTEFSALTVYKLDSRIENVGQPTVPDEDEATAMSTAQAEEA